jgi:glycosyltransferase involved in cell wall biosynthesis
VLIIRFSLHFVTETIRRKKFGISDKRDLLPQTSVKGILRISPKRVALSHGKTFAFAHRAETFLKMSKRGYRIYIVQDGAKPVSLGSTIFRRLYRFKTEMPDKSNPNLIFIYPPKVVTPSNALNEVIFTLMTTLTILLLWLLGSIKFGVIYSSRHYLGLAGGLTKMVTGVRWVADSDPNPPELYRGMRGFVRRTFERVTLSLHPDAMFVNDPAYVRDMENLTGREIHFVPICYDDIFKKRHSEEELLSFRKTHGLLEKIIVLYAGAIVPSIYRPDLLAETASYVIKQNSNVRFVVASPTTAGLNKLKRITSLMSISDYFVFLGTIPHSEIPLIMQVSDIVLNINSVANIGAKVTYVMISGKPVVASAPWFARYDKFFISGENIILIPLSSEALADAICNLAGNKELRNSIGMKAYTTIARYDSDYEAEFLRKLFFP